MAPLAAVALLALLVPFARAAGAAPQTTMIEVFPVGAPCTMLANFGDARSGGRTHEGEDIMAARGTPVYAAAAGRIRLSIGALSGNGLRLTAADGTYFYYAHLDAYAPGIGEGVTVAAGQVIGAVGDTGNAGPGNYHLHFEWHPGGGPAVDPYPTLAAMNGCSTTAPPPQQEVSTGFGGLTTITPTRFADTRQRSGLERLRAGVTQQLTVAGRNGVPSNAAAVAVNLTVTQPAAAGFLTVWPCGAAAPDTSNVNFAARATVANAATIGLGSGKLCVRASVDTHLVVDVTAWQAPPGELGFRPIVPVRVVDTRQTGQTVDAGGTLAVKVGGEKGLPAGARGVTANVTAVDSGASGFVTVWPCDRPKPDASTVNFAAGQAVPNSATVALGSDGTLCLDASVRTDVIVDVAGVWEPSDGSRFKPILPDRRLDTRQPGGIKLRGGAQARVPVAGVRGVPAAAHAAQLNVTVANPVATGFLTVFPCDTPVPDVSNVNFVAGQTVANASTVGLGNGAVCITSNVDTHLIVDVTGYLA